MARLPREDSRTAIPQLEKRTDNLEKRIENDTKEILDKIASLTDLFYPIGTVYETLNGDFDPNKTWGGEWERIKGKTLVGVDEDDTDFATSGNEGGAKGAWLHGHSQNCQFTVGYLSGSGTSGIPNGVSGWGSYGNAHWFGINANGSTNNQLPVDKANMPPYITVYMWRRTK